jgi:hypothetical protein
MPYVMDKNAIDATYAKVLAAISDASSNDDPAIICALLKAAAKVISVVQPPDQQRFAAKAAKATLRIFLRAVERGEPLDEDDVFGQNLAH